ncbi:MAG: hypothetical protein PHT32_07240, partial [Candidatus Omnitrophica bacterium]|nr:hypothetical protein [Candidatus Omnitrophota bacterium]
IRKRGDLLTEDWSKYNFASSPRYIYRHENVSWDALEIYYKAAHRKFYFRAGYILKRFMAGLCNGELPAYVKAFFDFVRSS